MFDYDSLPRGSSNYAKMPKPGEIAIFDIVTIKKVTAEDDPRGRFWVMKDEEIEAKDGRIIKQRVSQDWRLDCMLADGKILTLSSLSPIIAFKSAGVNDGMKIEVNHVGKGEYMIKILSGAKQDDAESVPF